MISCPCLKVEASVDYDPKKPFDGRGPSQGFVSWGNCIKCKHNRGSDEKTLKIKCGLDPKNVVTLKSIPI